MKSECSAKVAFFKFFPPSSNISAKFLNKRRL